MIKTNGYFYKSHKTRKHKFKIDNQRARITKPIKRHRGNKTVK